MNWQSLLYGVGGTIVGLGVALGLTNPKPEAYIDFAMVQGNEYLKTEACTAKLPLIGDSLKDECIQAVDTEAAQTRIRQALIDNTQRQNYILFSLYKSELSVEDLLPIPSSMVPVYYVESVGALTLFKVYNAGEQ
ncbi:DUF4359 domain-containing protein [Prochlorothrix hollandica]|uniref:DUF4359 domain-containing protein n=1 Tax=Prochlorothrix hollandica PCC 9006 = CALU 1027 TaxID=317619 RepID=A0A0M2PPC2_PROHO|nr:DUF4359 domain-containing protein [Prochlorothrix hollandica]KKI98425.1 hypothetical protein PROH_18375 [Prochlorothrix hollandica PCC 9006 = CALU 1027]